MKKFTASVFLTLILISSKGQPLFGGAPEDEAKIQQISDRNGCYETFKAILHENIQHADRNDLEKSQPAIKEVLASIDFWQSHPQSLENVSWDLYPKFVKAYCLLQGLETQSNEQFLRDGFTQGIINSQLNLNLLATFQHTKNIPFILEDCDPNYLCSKMGMITAERLSQNHTYTMLENHHIEALKPILLSLKEPITECIGTPWRVTNVRAWKTAPTCEEFGPNAWHTDGLPFTALKIMLYPSGTDYKKGTIELQLPYGIHSIEGQAGSWVLFKNSEIVHRAIAPKTGERIALEITIVPSISWNLEPICVGQNARHPFLPWQKPYVSQHSTYKKGELIGINIGGGPNWSCDKWVNLEEVLSSVNLHPFHLFPNCHFPLENESVQIVYTSHAIEHLNIPTVYRILSESHRVLENGGNLVIKIPDYEKVLDCWRRQDSSFFNGWNIESVSHLWPARGVCDCIDHRAAMIFCSFFNDAYGNPFQGSPNSNTSHAYYGPPIVSVTFLRNLIQHNSPRHIANELRKAIGLAEHNFHFCHQSAWSREELKEMLNEFGFELISFDPTRIVKTFETIPGIDEMKNISTFCWVKKKIK